MRLPPFLRQIGSYLVVMALGAVLAVYLIPARVVVETRSVEVVKEVLVGTPNRPEPAGAKEALAAVCAESGSECVRFVYLGGTAETDSQYEVAVFIAIESDGNESVHYVFLEGGEVAKVR